MKRIVQAAVLRQPGGAFEAQPVLLGALGPDEVLVRVAGVGICHTDVAVRDRVIPVPLPAVLGHEAAGIVEEVGAAIDDIAPGDQVVLSYSSCGTCVACEAEVPGYCEEFVARNFRGTRHDGSTAYADDGGAIGSHFFGQSSFATFAVTRRRNVVKVESALPLELLGPLGCGIQTGAGAVFNALNCPQGSSLAIFGAGSVGLSAVLAAVARGCGTIVVVEPVAARRALALSLGATHSRKHLKRWMRPERRPVEPRLLGLFGARAEIIFQPKGVVGVVAPWNFPVGLVFSPLANVLAAGNRPIVKPSEHTPRTSALLAELIAARFDPVELAVVTGGPELGAAFAALPFDHLIFTGAGSIASHVMRAASEHLVPLTLELGGKSPVVIGRGADLGVAAARIMAGKLLNAGQICLAPDHLFIRDVQRDAFVDHVGQAVRTMLPTMRDNPDYTAIISDRHHERLTGYVADARQKGATIVELSPAGETFAQQEHRKIPPMLILDATPDMTVMKEEIFGPLLPVMRYDRLPDLVERINGGERPLALYYFGTARDEIDLLISRTTSGGICINDVIMHCAQENLPFGGIGPSGMGAYHGRDGFMEFSHRKAVYRQIGRDLGPLKTFRPPYDQRVRKLVRSVIGA